MVIIRKILGKFFIFFNDLFSPQAITRSAQRQADLDQLTQHIKLYQFNACPFCIKVRRAIRRMALNIEIRDVNENQQFKSELLNEGGRIQAPCLRIIDEKGQKMWLYESSDIIQYLQKLI